MKRFIRSAASRWYSRQVRRIETALIAEGVTGADHSLGSRWTPYGLASLAVVAAFPRRVALIDFGKPRRALNRMADLTADDLIMGRPIYYDRAGNPIPREQAYELFKDPENKRVGLDTVGEARVSTVHLMIDHNFGDGPPIIFETMIFGGKHDDFTERYSTEAEALAGHQRVVQALREGWEP